MTLTTKPLEVQTFPVSAWVWILRLKGCVDASNVALLQAATKSLFERGISRIAVDLSDVEFMSSTAYGCLIGAHDDAERNGGRLIFCGASLAVREVFRLLGLCDVLHLTEDLAVALRRLERRETPPAE
jgi:anti-sigma B factor antagonist